MFLDNNNTFGNNTASNVAPAYTNSSINNTTYPHSWSTAISRNVWLKMLPQINATIYLAAGDFINFKSCSE